MSRDTHLGNKTIKKEMITIKMNLLDSYICVLFYSKNNYFLKIQMFIIKGVFLFVCFL